MMEWNNIVKMYNENQQEISKDPRRSALAKKDDLSNLKTEMEQQQGKYIETLQALWKDLKKDTVMEDKKNIPEVAHAITIIKSIGKGMTPDIFDSIITDTMKNDLGAMQQLRAVVYSEGLDENINDCSAFKILKAYERINQSIYDVEQFSYSVLTNWDLGAKRGIDQYYLKERLDQLDNWIDTIQNGTKNAME